jgi:hydroxymethylbilane synthase
MAIDAFVGLPDGSEWIRDRVEGEAAEPATLGAELAQRLLATGARDILDRAEHWTGGRV